MNMKAEERFAQSVAGVWIRNDEVLLGRRKPGGSMGLRWELPGGKREKGESGPEALVREFVEEFGMRVVVGEVLAQAYFHHAGQAHRVIAYRVEGRLPIPELREHEEIKWFPLSSLPSDMVDSDSELLTVIRRDCPTLKQD